jgi:hypothetical protein
MPLDNDTPNVRNKPATRPEVAAEKEIVIAAHDQAEKDIEADAELTIDPRPEDDLDEGEIARFEAGDTGKTGDEEI